MIEAQASMFLDEKERETGFVVHQVTTRKLFLL